MIVDVKAVRKTFVIPVAENSGLLASFRRTKKEVVALDRVSLEIREGESVALLGPNGAGKSTLIKLICSILQPSSGSVRVFGEDPIENRLTTTKKLGLVVGQKSLLFSEIPVMDSLKLISRIYAIDEREFEKHLTELDSVLQIYDLLSTPPRRLSLGQRMRCELAAAILHKPTLLVLDEPSIGLDLNAKFALMAYLKELRKKTSITLILTTHSLEEVAALSERIVVLSKGKIVCDASTEELKRRVKTQTIRFRRPASPATHEETLPKDKVQARLLEILKEPVADLSILEPSIEQSIVEFFQ